MLILIAVLAFPQIKLALRKDAGASAMPAGYYDVPLNLRINYAVYYFGLSAYLAVMAYDLHGMLSA